MARQERSVCTPEHWRVEADGTEIVERMDVFEVEPTRYTDVEFAALPARVQRREFAAHRNAGRPVREWVEQNGWQITSGEDGELECSLEPWRGCDLDAVWIQVVVQEMPRSIYDDERAAGRDPFFSLRAGQRPAR